VEDVLPLARHFLAEAHPEYKRLSRAAANALAAYPWPGNVRELANAMEHARLLSPAEVVLPEHLPPAVRDAASQTATRPEDAIEATPPSPRTLEETEVEAIRRALEQTGGNRTRAAELLGITRRGLIYKLKRLGLS
jgi:DNA-binding NtrC family response regulator